MILKAEDFKLSSFFQNQSESELSVPDFQRSYSWGIDQVKEFWEDLDSIRTKPGIHYLGAFIFVRTDDNNLNILDGQQRITTIFLLLYSIQNVLKQRYSKEEFTLERITNQLYKTDYATEERKSRLKLNNFDDIFFRSLINNNTNQPSLSSHNKLQDTLKYFKSELDKIADNFGVQGIKEVYNTLLDKFFIISITSNSYENANLFFETLNDRGLELTKLDLIKNYIFQFSIDKTDEQDFLRKWEDILINTHDIEINQFLMHYWSSVHGEVRKNEIYSRFKNKIKSKRDALIEIENIRLASQIYKNLKDPSTDYWEDKEIVGYLKALRIFKLDMIYIPLLSIGMKHSHNINILRKYFSELLKFTFNYNVICKKPTNILLPKYISIANRIFLGEMSIEIFIGELRTNVPSYGEIKKSFEAFQPTNEIARFILLEINKKKKFHDEGFNEVVFDSDSLHLEHIIPQKWEKDKEWVESFKNSESDGSDKHKEDSKREIQFAVRSFGNMTLLFNEFNRRAQNKYFIWKRNEIYSNSKIPTTRELLDYSEFSINQVADRQKELFDYINETWLSYHNKK